MSAAITVTELPAFGRWRGMCVRPEHFLFAAVPVVSGRRSPAGRGPVRRDQQEPGRGETLRRMRSRVHAEIQPGKYCPDCAVRMRRKKEAERQRQRYLSLVARK